LVDDQIALGRGRRTDMDGRVRHLDVQRILVGVGIDGAGLAPHSAGGLADPAGDFAASCDQNALEHERRKSPATKTGDFAAPQRKVNRTALRRGRDTYFGRSSAAVRSPIGGSLCALSAASRTTIPCSTGNS